MQIIYITYYVLEAKQGFAKDKLNLISNAKYEFLVFK